MDRWEFERLLHGEPAAEEDVRRITMLADMILEPERSVTQASAKFMNEETGAMVVCTVEFNDTTSVDVCPVIVQVGYEQKEDWDYTVTYHKNSDLPDQSYPIEEPETSQALNSAERALQEVMDGADDSYDQDVVEVIKNLQRLVAFCKDPDVIRSMSNVVEFSDPTPAVEVARRAAITYGFTDAIRVRSAGMSLAHTATGFESIDVASSERIGTAGESDEPDKQLQIELRDSVGGTHVFLKTDEELTYEYEIGGTPNEVEYEQGETFDEAACAMLASIYKDALTPEAAGYFKNALEEFMVQEMETNIELGDAPFVYPELGFGFCADKFLGADGEPSVEAVTRDVLRALDDTARLQLPEACPDGTPALPPFNHSPNRSKRVRKFLNTRTNIPLDGHIARAEIYDIHLAAQSIVDRLAYQNHPVAQALAELYIDYSDMLGDVCIQKVTTEVVIQTHETELKRYYQEAIAERRATRRLGSVALPLQPAGRETD